MAIATIEEDQIPEHYGSYSHVEIVNTGGNAIGQEIIAAGHHPKMRLVHAQYVSMVYADAGHIVTIEKGDGTDLTTALACSTTALNSVDGVPIVGVVVEKNEAVRLLSGSEGGATTVVMVALRFETIH